MTYIFRPPYREYVIVILVVLAFTFHLLQPAYYIPLLFAGLLGSLPTVWGGITALFQRRINIDAFNTFAIAISFAAGELRSAAFIVLMLAFARVLEWHTESRMHNAVEELLKLKPDRAVRERGSAIEEVPSNEVNVGDILIAKEGSRIAVDGTVTYGEGYMNEAPISGESVPVRKAICDGVFAGTLMESGTLKFRADRVGKDSTLEKMAQLIEQASKNKSRSEKLADKFARMFLPAVAAVGLLVYIITRNTQMTAALFLVACADDVVVAIPLAVTGALGRAAKKGIVIKGGEWLDVLARVKTVVLDKTGTLTYGKFVVSNAEIDASLSSETFWLLVGMAEKFSSHPIGKAVFQHAQKIVPEIPDPDMLQIHKGSGLQARYKKDEIAIGNEEIIHKLQLPISEQMRARWDSIRGGYGGTTFLVFLNRQVTGFITVADVPREEARQSLEMLRQLGVQEIIMFTGDSKEIAARVASDLGILDFKAAMRPEDKLREFEMLGKRPVAMVGDGINDAPALARADVGIAMGSGGTAVAVEAADVVMLTDNLAGLPEVIAISRAAMSVVRGDMIIWGISNLLGFALVLTGIAGPVLAAFYNFATDFLPLINSARLFKRPSETTNFPT